MIRVSLYVEPHGAGAQKPLHARREVGLWDPGEQLEVTGHQAARAELPTGPGAGVGQRIEVLLPVGVIANAKDGLAAVTLVEGVMRRPGYSTLSSSHGPEPARLDRICQYQEPTPLKLRRRRGGRFQKEEVSNARRFLLTVLVDGGKACGRDPASSRECGRRTRVRQWLPPEDANPRSGVEAVQPKDAS